MVCAAAGKSLPLVVVSERQQFAIRNNAITFLQQMLSVACDMPLEFSADAH
jgi:hypothetical protein